MAHILKILVMCPNCKKSLMAPERQIDGLDAIRISARVLKSEGDIYLSQVYGSYRKEFNGVINVEGTIVEGACPHCHTPFPIQQECECGASIFGLALQGGGIINVCSRNGCKQHSLEFENADDAFDLFRRQNVSGFF